MIISPIPRAERSRTAAEWSIIRDMKAVAIHPRRVRSAAVLPRCLRAARAQPLR
jgi:hypothetical protein